MHFECVILFAPKVMSLAFHRPCLPVPTTSSNGCPNVRLMGYAEMYPKGLVQA